MSRTKKASKRTRKTARRKSIDPCMVRVAVYEKQFKGLVDRAEAAVMHTLVASLKEQHLQTYYALCQVALSIQVIRHELRRAPNVSAIEGEATHGS